MAKKNANLKTKLPQLRRPPALPRGPRLFQPVPLSQQPITQGPGEPPPGFVTATTSKTEWYIFWSLCKILDPAGDARQPPFEGRYPYFAYQAFAQGGRQGPGGSVIDFVVYSIASKKMNIGLRIVTEYWHLYTDNKKQADDDIQKISLESELDIIDIVDSDFISDTTGQAAIIVTKNALGLIEKPNPLLFGTSIRGSRMDSLS